MDPRRADQTAAVDFGWEQVVVVAAAHLGLASAWAVGLGSGQAVGSG